MNQTSRWRPISDLPVMASILDSMLHDDEGQYRTLCECRPKPYVLDDHTVGRVIQVFTQQKTDLPLSVVKIPSAAESVTWLLTIVSLHRPPAVLGNRL